MTYGEGDSSEPRERLEVDVVPQSLSPKELAEALGVSESSLKRWVDAGRLPAERTPGGHRRISPQDAVRFVRESRLPLVRPERIGMTDLASLTDRRRSGPDGRTEDEQRTADLIYEALRDGHEALARGLVLQCYLDGTDVAMICDGPLRSALHRVGELWRHEPAGIAVEHRATDIAIQAINQMRTFVTPRDAEHPPAHPAGPLAVGGAPSGDPYLIPSLMAACVLSDAGFRTINLGPDTPMDPLENAAHEYQAQLVWLSCSATKTALPDVAPLNDLAEHLATRHTPLVVGGRTVPALGATRHANLHCCRSMAELAAFARGLRTRPNP